MSFAGPRQKLAKTARKKAKPRLKVKRRDPIFIDGARPRPMYVDYKDLELLGKLVNRQAKIISRRKSGCTAASQHAVTSAIKRAAVHGAASLRGRVAVPGHDVMGPLTTRRRVEFRDTDAAGIVHFSAFFFWMESAEHELLRAAGIAVVDRGADGIDASWPRVSATCDYVSAVRFGDEVEIAVSVTAVGRSSVTYAFAFSHAGTAVARGRWSRCDA